MKIATIAALMCAVSAYAEVRTVLLPGKSPLVDFRIVFRTGSAYDPAGKAGAASLTAAMLAEGGTKSLTYTQILDKLYPMAASVEGSADKEMTVFSGTTHIDNLEAYYAILRSMILEPGWREDDLARLKDDAVNYLRVSLRGNNDEELGKDVLVNEIFRGHPYGRHVVGEVSAIRSLTLEDLKAFYAANFTQANVIVGLAGGYPAGFAERVAKDFSKLPAGKPNALKLPEPKMDEGLRAVIVKKDTRSVAYSLGFPIEVRRGHPDFPALLVAQSWLGQHRSSGAWLYNRMREARGLNYGDYAYIEHFPLGMFRFEPPPNIARRQQIFQIWIRPVEVPTAHFALRLGLHEFHKMLEQGIPQEGFDNTRNFLSKYVNLLTKTKSAELGYAIDSLFYGIPDYGAYVRSALAKLTREDVNRAIRKHLDRKRMVIVAIARDAEQLKDMLVSNAESPMTYNSPKPEDILAEDKIVQKLTIPLKAEAVRIVPVETVFE